MPPKKQVSIPTSSAKPVKVPESKKRKVPPQSSSNNDKGAGTRRDFKRVKIQDARSILTQASDAALKHGELDIQSFLKSREFEIKALQNGMQKAQQGRNSRAFQQVPRDMRRRTASHNVKRVPKRLQRRATREMKDDNTPTVNPSKRKPRSSRGRLRAETAKRLGILAAKKRDKKTATKDVSGIDTRVALSKLRTDRLNDPPKPKAKFRKREIHKTWLPTHLWHAKRAKMTEPKNPLWRFAIPITSTEKSYRPTHRAGGARGAVAWDTSYMSTIGLEGPCPSLEKLLKALGITEPSLWGEKGTKWRDGKRSWSGWLTRQVNNIPVFIGPSTIVWCPPEKEPPDLESSVKSKKSFSRRLFIRIHPAAFLEAWAELARLSKLQRPAVHLQDLRFEIGSIEITGPGSTETLLGILQPYPEVDLHDGHAKTFTSLAGVTNPSSLPDNALLSFSIMDPRLRYPPRRAKIPDPSDDSAHFALLEHLSAWPVDATLGCPNLFNRNARFKAAHLPSQKALNRRKALAPPGEYPPVTEADPPIPIMLLTSRVPQPGSSQGTWILLAPWKCVLPIWYGLMHFPLSSGGNPRFGGLQELRQIHFEHGVAWFPADYPGTSAGFAWEAEERLRRKAEWEKRPKGKRIEYDSLDLGSGRKGEIGRGWACDYERIIGLPLSSAESSTIETTLEPQALSRESTRPENLPTTHLPSKIFHLLLSSLQPELPPDSTLGTIRITLVGRGVASPCARIYRLPPESPRADSSTSRDPLATTREQWLSLLPSRSVSKPAPNPKKVKRVGRIPLNVPLPQRVRMLAQSLLEPPQERSGGCDDKHPPVPDEDDLIGFVTTGEFNLAEGKAAAIGSVVVAKVLEGKKRDGECKTGESKLCIVRNSGENVARLARWEVV